MLLLHLVSGLRKMLTHTFKTHARIGDIACTFNSVNASVDAESARYPLLLLNPVITEEPPNIAVQVTAALAQSGRVRSFRGRGEAFQQTRQLAAPDGWVVGRLVDGKAVWKRAPWDDCGQTYR